MITKDALIQNATVKLADINMFRMVNTKDILSVANLQGITTWSSFTNPDLISVTFVDKSGNLYRNCDVANDVPLTVLKPHVVETLVEYQARMARKLAKAA